MADVPVVTVSTSILTYGALPVPYAAAWSAESRTFIASCPWARCAAICQEEARGQGKPMFGTPHFGRQREVIVRGLCDLCARPLRNTTKVSLSHARARMNGAKALDVLQVEPLLHRDCAAESVRHCPSLKRDIAHGTLEVRRVTRHAFQLALSNPKFIAKYVPGYVENPNDRIVAHAKVQLLAWQAMRPEWIGVDQ